ncbi:hypothetical protein ASD04_11110 [Devosia sp. Root436]|jgi:uncharacterized membrane protein (DUF4010 family)|uniref:MgtC/SapB family protein n=1 Tax=Devosia sp. Root436 TaxID=1736537 RepID=UPI0006FFB156|nr:MgtC/SapB family protein [Devosia sp. Root436]KQX38166.1 hypothetical protein ASD04_11110 [Devosia sp. Root436]
MEQAEVLSRLGVSLAIGLLVGLERGWSQREEEDHQRAAGFRTFALSGLLGGVAGLVSLSAGGVVLGLVFVAYAAAFAAFHWLEATTDSNLSATSVIAGLLTFLLGALAVLGDVGVSAAAAVAAATLLAFREQMHRWVANLTWAEISSVLILLAMTFLLLPLLPDRTIDPWKAINPHEVWLLTILIAGISFVGYVAMKVFGNRMGILLAAAVGGLASSTATTLALSRVGRDHSKSSRLLAAGILLAGVVMMARVTGIALLLNAPLVAGIILPIASAGAVLGLSALLLAVGPSDPTSPLMTASNPLAIGTALKLGAVIGAVMLAVGYLRSVLGSAGVLIVAAISGMVDADAVTLSMARLGGDAVDLQTAGQAIMVGVAVNTLVRAGISLVLGGWRLGLMVAAGSLTALATGLVVAWPPF